MHANALIALAGTECGARLILLDPVEGELDITDADASFNRRSAATIERYFAAEGLPVVDLSKGHLDPSDG